MRDEMPWSLLFNKGFFTDWGYPTINSVQIGGTPRKCVQIGGTPQKFCTDWGYPPKINSDWGYPTSKCTLQIRGTPHNFLTDWSQPPQFFTDWSHTPTCPHHRTVSILYVHVSRSTNTSMAPQRSGRAARPDPVFDELVDESDYFSLPLLCQACHVDAGYQPTVSHMGGGDLPTLGCV